MADPVTTPRQTPAGIKLWDGFSTTIAFALDPDVSFWEVTVQPPSLDGGDPVDQSTMHNTTFRTKRMRQLIEVGDITGTCAYDPAVFSQLIGLINNEGSITVHYPDGTTQDIFGAIRLFEPDALEDGTQPMASFTIVSTSYDPANNVEAGPVITSAEGT